MPDYRIGMIARVDVQRPLPGVIIEFHFSIMLEDPLATARHPQLTLLLANLTVQLVIAVDTVQTGQRYLRYITNTPVSAQSLS